jgi:hypothetical protein
MAMNRPGQLPTPGQHFLGSTVLAAALCAAPAAHAQDHFSIGAWLGASTGHSNNLGISLSHAPGGVQRSGLRWQAAAMRGSYRYRHADAPDEWVRGRYADISAAVGYEIVAPAGGVMFSIGPSIYDKDLSFVPPGERTGTWLGAKVSALGHARMPKGTAFFGYGSYSTADNTGNVYVNLGLPLSGGLSAGPELAFLDASDYRQTRVGLHLSGLRLGGFSAGVSAGRSRDMDGNHESHLGLNVYRSF